MRVVVYCGSSDLVPAGDLAVGEEMGRLLAEHGHTLVFGGGKVGLMGTASRGARAAGGKVIGVILDRFIDMGVDDPEVDEMVVTTTMRERKRGLEERCDAHLVLPGGVGTLDELFEILSLKYLDLNQKPVIVLNHEGFFSPILELLDRLGATGYLRGGKENLLQVATTPQGAMDLLASSGS